MIVFSLRLVIPNAQRNDFIQGISALLEPTRVTPGCLACRLLVDFESSNKFTLIEEWSSQAHLDHHLVSEASKTLIAVMEMSAKTPTIQFDDVAQRAGLEVVEEAWRAQGLL